MVVCVATALLSCADQADGEDATASDPSSPTATGGAGEVGDGGQETDHEPSDSGGDESGPGGDATESDDDGSGEEGSTGADEPFDPGLCGEAPPAGSPLPPAAPGYSGGACPAFAAGYNTGFVAGGLTREFALLLPAEADETGTYPLLFAWYHISGNAMDFVDQLDAQALADAGRSIIVVPQDSGMFEATWPDTPLDIAQSGVDLAMFDDLYACLSQQFPINSQCVSSIGVSAGGLWTSYLGTVRGQYLASNLTISGGHPSEFTGPWWPWNSPRPYASLVLWGGPSDVLGIDFHAASLNLVGNLSGSGHFVLRCEHTGGHGVPPVGDGDPLQTALHFARNHPYWLDGDSPLDAGLPAFYPSYCLAL